MILIQNLLVFIFFYEATGFQHLGEHIGDVYTYPGTKWCGPGSIASDDNDFGPEIKEDKCCQTHDKCPDYIEASQTKYNLKNPADFTRVLCKCDKQFYTCLKKADTEVSNDIGNIYFNHIGTQCFNKQGGSYHWEDVPVY